MAEGNIPGGCAARSGGLRATHPLGSGSCVLSADEWNRGDPPR
ncbi:hypothetical protein [Desulfonema ishimotonii]|nr:hypothetical protein [Desulfonema ishimotonii]